MPSRSFLYCILFHFKIREFLNKCYNLLWVGWNLDKFGLPFTFFFWNDYYLREKLLSKSCLTQNQDDSPSREGITFHLYFPSTKTLKFSITLHDVVIFSFSNEVFRNCCSYWTAEIHVTYVITKDSAKFP